MRGLAVFQAPLNFRVHYNFSAVLDSMSKTNQGRTYVINIYINAIIEPGPLDIEKLIR